MCAPVQRPHREIERHVVSRSVLHRLHSTRHADTGTLTARVRAGSLRAPSLSSLFLPQTDLEKVRTNSLLRINRERQHPSTVAEQPLPTVACSSVLLRRLRLLRLLPPPALRRHARNMGSTAANIEVVQAPQGSTSYATQRRWRRRWHRSPPTDAAWLLILSDSPNGGVRERRNAVGKGQGSGQAGVIVVRWVRRLLHTSPADDSAGA